MITCLLTDTLKGSLIFLLVAATDRLVSGFMRARWRRLWWVLVPAAFLWPVQIPLSFPDPAGKGAVPVSILASHAEAAVHDIGVAATDVSHPSAKLASWLLFIWLAGAATSGLG